MRANPHTHRIISKSEHGRIEKCCCGAVRLHFGALTLRLQADAFFELSTLLAQGAEQYAQPQLTLNAHTPALGEA